VWLSLAAGTLLGAFGGQASAAAASTVEATLAPTVEATLAPTVEATLAPKVEPTVESPLAPTVKATLAPKVEATSPHPSSSAPSTSAESSPSRVTLAGEVATDVQVAGSAGSSQQEAAGASATTDLPRSPPAAGAAATARGAWMSGVGRGGLSRTPSLDDTGSRGWSSQPADGFGTTPTWAQPIGGDAFGGPSEVLASESPNSGSPLTSSSPRVDTVLGIRVPPEVKQGALLAMLTILGGMFLLGLLFADEAGIGPRHPEWRARWSYLLPWR
jgi:hypothetical protein